MDIRQIVKQFLISGKLKSPVKYLTDMGVIIGNGCHIRYCLVNAKEGYLIKIGNFVRISQNVIFFTHGGLEQMKIYYNDLSYDVFGKITIGDYVFIGEGVKIMPGVSIGSNVIIGAGAVVTKSIPDNCIVGGNPIKYLGKTDEYYKNMEKFNTKTGTLLDEDKKEILLNLPEDMFIQKSALKIIE